VRWRYMYIKGEDRNQITLFPEAVDDYIASDNPVRVIEAFVNSLDMQELGFQRAVPKNTGRPPYDPRDILKLYLYGYLNRIRSSRRLETEAGRNLELIWLLRKLKPDFKTIADFRKDNSKALKGVFRQFTKLCREWALYGKEVIAVDGSKFRAVNSKRNNYNQKKIQRHLKYIDEKINNYLEELDRNDEAEADIHVPSAEEIQKRIEELKNHKEKYLNLQQQLEETGATEISTTDPDARLMVVNNKGIDVSYNVQVAVDQKHKLVVESEVINNPSDQGQLSVMAKQAKEVLGVEKIKALADKGYYSSNDLIECEENQIETYVTKQRCTGNIANPDFQADKFQYDQEQDVYLCPAGEKLYPGRIRESSGVKYQVYRNYRACKACHLKEQCTKAQRGRTINRNLAQPLLDEINRRTKENDQLYKERQRIVEHLFGTIKRVWGYNYFLTRGLDSVSAENKLQLLAYNLRRVINILGVKEIVKRLTPAQA
jgi:transposase